MAEERIKELDSAGKKVAVLDAAVLLAADWHTIMCNEVWSCVIHPEEAVTRISDRDGKSAEDARRRLSSQPANRDVVAASTVVFCTQWDPSYTQGQVEKAWRWLMDELGQ